MTKKCNGAQVEFYNNRYSNISQWAYRLEKVTPKARIALVSPVVNGSIDH